ncbi:zinc finger and SCAN domain-containing protein 4 [Molossus molossus]|uniref:Zinc finger and SCAN domain-containing protein 4 n=1 Tax=Molossus molossus TaxID=27622 RepID=A0A7J8CCX6_MOLMO|nr:zinc finger and SCAN domain-containing protein 4 [Molossus molossus]KAF6408753.1 zinc finger and SCAN domain containing 4 [Molossus molossus]
MAFNLRVSRRGEPSRNGPGSENLELQPIRGPAIQEREGVSTFPSTEFNLIQNSSNLCARQELQQLYTSFNSWLQPEKHSKEEIISRLVLEQFMINRHCSDRSMLKQKWESSGRNLKTFVEDLSDDCLKPPGLVHVHMQGQEALFSENMPLREVIVLFNKQLSAGTPTETNVGMPSWTPQDTSLPTGQDDEDKENNGNSSLKTTEVNNSIISQGSEIPFLLIIPGENCPGHEEGGVSLENPLSSGRASLGTSLSQEGPLEGPSYQGVLMKVEPAFHSMPDQVTTELVPTHQSNTGDSTRGGHQESGHRARKSYQCEECSKIFRYFSRLKVHQRRHSNERTFICATCDKGFFQASDLHVHQKIHAGEKPFRCSTCAKRFSHKTNLLAHERIHTGEKPYMCSECKRCYRQSSTYHRHLRMHQRTAFSCVSSTTNDSSM